MLKFIAEVMRKKILSKKYLVNCLYKAELDLEFLCKCVDNNIAPNVLHFSVANNHLKYLSTHKKCQIYRDKKLVRKSLQYKINRKNLALSKELYEISLI